MSWTVLLVTRTCAYCYICRTSSWWLLYFFRIKHVIISVPKYVFHCLQFFSLYNKGRIEQDLDSHTVNILISRKNVSTEWECKWIWFELKVTSWTSQAIWICRRLPVCHGHWLYSNYDATNFALTVYVFVNEHEAYASQSRSRRLVQKQK